MRRHNPGQTFPFRAAVLTCWTLGRRAPHVQQGRRVLKVIVRE